MENIIIEIEKNENIEKLLSENLKSLWYENTNKKIFVLDWFGMDFEAREKICKIGKQDFEDEKWSKWEADQDVGYFLYFFSEDLKLIFKENPNCIDWNIEVSRRIISRMEKEDPDDVYVLFFKGVICARFEKSFDDARAYFSRVSKMRRDCMRESAIKWFIFMDLAEDNYEGAASWIKSLLYNCAHQDLEFYIKQVGCLMSEVEGGEANFTEFFRGECDDLMDKIENESIKPFGLKKALEAIDIDFESIRKTHIDDFQDDMAEKEPIKDAVGRPGEKENFFEKAESSLKDKLGEDICRQINEQSRQWLILGESSYLAYSAAIGKCKRIYESGVQYYLHGIATELFLRVFKRLRDEILLNYSVGDKRDVFGDEFYRYFTDNAFTPTLKQMIRFVDISRKKRSLPLARKMNDFINYISPELMEYDFGIEIRKISEEREALAHPVNYEPRKVDFDYVRDVLFGEKGKEGLLRRLVRG
jgi:hypothetical protein